MCKNIRTLRANEIECRIGQISKDGRGLSLLLYKDARCDMNILDETFGPLNWKRRHCRDNANCIVSIWDDEKKEWIEKEDTGTESNTEAEKGLASDSFKRACVNVGIGRELYTAPFIWIPAELCNISGNKCYDKFDVTKIEYNDNREISALEIANEKTGNLVFVFPKTAQGAKKRPQRENAESSAEESEEDKVMFSCRDCGNPLVWTRTKDGKDMSPVDIRDLSYARYGRILCPNCMKIEAAKRKGESA